MNITYDSLDTLKEKVNSITNSINTKLSSNTIIDTTNIFKKIHPNYFIYTFIVVTIAIILGVCRPVMILSKDINNNYYINSFKFLIALVIISAILIIFVRAIINKKFT
jgi:hypothetical protein